MNKIIKLKNHADLKICKTILVSPKVFCKISPPERSFNSPHQTTSLTQPINNDLSFILKANFWHFLPKHVVISIHNLILFEENLHYSKLYCWRVNWLNLRIIYSHLFSDGLQSDIPHTSLFSHHGTWTEIGIKV